MNLSKITNAFRLWTKGKGNKQIRQFALTSVLTIAMSLSLISCSMFDDPPEIGVVGAVEGFLGGVVSDEPRAALVGREILSAGGTATDAIVGMYFTLSVTLPSAASLGGGGVCVVRDAASGDAKSLNFLARLPQTIPGTASRPSAIPGNPRGIYALHAKYGNLRWQSLVAPAATLARFGTPVSRALSKDLLVAKDALAVDPAFSKVFFNEQTGALVDEGGVLKQVDLSTILSQMSSNGPADFYNGQTAAHLVDAVERAGGSLSLADLRGYRPYWEDTLKLPYGDHHIHFPLPPAAAGVVEASMLYGLVDKDLYLEAEGALEITHTLAELSQIGFADRARWMLDYGETRWSAIELANMTRLDRDLNLFSIDKHIPSSGLSILPVKRDENASGTSLVAVDNQGGAVACNFTMNNLFGTGRIAAGTGIVLATIPNANGRGPISSGPMIIDNKNSNKFFWAGAATGGAAAPTALINVAARAILGNESLYSAMTAKRVHHGGYPDTTFYEDGMEQWVVDGLKNRGHNVASTPSIGLVNAIYCRANLPEHPESCEVVADPRGNGLAAMSE